MKSINKKKLFYIFILLNIALLVYAYFKGNLLDIEMLKAYLSEQNFVVSYLIYIAILIKKS